MNPRRRRHNRHARGLREQCRLFGITVEDWRSRKPEERMEFLVRMLMSGVRDGGALPSPMPKPIPTVERERLAVGWHVGGKLLPLVGGAS